MSKLTGPPKPNPKKTDGNTEEVVDSMADDAHKVINAGRSDRQAKVKNTM